MYKVKYQEKDPGTVYSNKKITNVPGEDLKKHQVEEKLAEKLGISKDAVIIHELEEV